MKVSFASLREKLCDKMESKNCNYQKEWEEYRKQRNRHWAICLSCFLLFPLGILYFKLIDLDAANPLLQYFLWIVFGAAVWFNLSKFNRWKCPYCKEPFLTYSFKVSFWSSGPRINNKCGHCGLPKFFGSTFYQSKLGFYPKLKH